MKKVKCKPAPNRDRTGKFKRGCSGNPQGRKPGIPDRRVMLREMINPHAGELITRAIRMAKAGDAQMMKLLLDRTCPTLKPQAELIQSYIPNEKDLNKQAASIFNKVLSGELSPDEGMALINLLNARISIETATILEKRLAALEQALENDSD